MKKSKGLSPVVASVVAALYAQVAAEAQAATKPMEIQVNTAAGLRTACPPDGYETVVSKRDYVVRVPCGQKAQLASDFVNAVRSVATAKTPTPAESRAMEQLPKNVAHRLNTQFDFIGESMTSIMLLPEGQDKKTMKVEMGVESGRDVNSYYSAVFNCERYSHVTGRIAVDCKISDGKLMQETDAAASNALFAPPSDEDLKKMPVWGASLPVPGVK